MLHSAKKNGITQWTGAATTFEYMYNLVQFVFYQCLLNKDDTMASN